MVTLIRGAVRVQQEPYKYWAFISYSHRDKAWADWLHKALETYRVPRRLVGREGPTGPAPKRLFPVFRDQEELPSSHSLTSAIDEALRLSRFLIVIASPYAAVSKWVDQEIQRFRELGRGERILCLIVDGEPHADLQPGKGFLECFPPSLCADSGWEPIAADVRPGRDGRIAAKQKIIAGLLGLGLDELRRREQRRRMLRNIGWTVGGTLVAAALAVTWQVQQREKNAALEQQRLRTHIETVYEKGRQELLAHNQARAAVYLNEAYRLGVDTPALRFMLARAMRIVEAERLVFDAGAPLFLVRFSPDAKRLLTVDEHKVGRVWDAATGKQQFGFEYPVRAKVFSPRFSRNNRLLYVYVVPDDASTGYLNYWDVETGNLLGKVINAPTTTHTFNPFDDSGRRVAHLAPDYAAEINDLYTGRVLSRLPGPFCAVGFSRDGRNLITASNDGTVTRWDGEGHRRLMNYRGLHSTIVSLDDTEDGTLIAAAAKDGSIRAWETRSGETRVLAGHPSPQPWLIFNMDGTRLFTAAADGGRVWNTVNGALVYALRFSGTAGNDYDFSSDGRWMLLSDTSRLAIQDLESGVEMYTLDGNRGMAHARDISDDDSHIVTGGPDGRVVLWNTPSIPEFEFRHVLDPLAWDKRWRPGVAAVYSHDGALIATGAADGLLKIWSAASRKLIRSVPADPQSLNVLNFSADGKRIVGGGESSGLKIWMVEDGRLVGNFDCGGKEVLNAAFSSDGRYVSASTYGGATKVWDTTNGELVASFDIPVAVMSAFSPDGKRIAVGVGDEVRFWDIRQRQYVWRFHTKVKASSGSSIAALDFSADGSRLLVASIGRSAFILDAHDGHLLKRLDEPSASRFLTARFSHDGWLAVMSDRSGVAILWRPDDGRTWILQGHAGEVRTAIFSADDNFVLTSGVDATAKIWDTLSGELLDTVAIHSAPLPEVPFHAAEFRPDDQAVLTGSIDGVIREWGLRVETRSPEHINVILQCRIPWQIQGEDLTLRTPNDSICPSMSSR
ncbi:MAG: TIR domain-containing protein [Nevskia sp.]|nr:TIR domain-containing protein [Nevskia sp.]